MVYASSAAEPPRITAVGVGALATAVAASVPVFIQTLPPGALAVPVAAESGAVTEALPLMPPIVPDAQDGYVSTGIGIGSSSASNGENDGKAVHVRWARRHDRAVGWSRLGIVAQTGGAAGAGKPVRGWSGAALLGPIVVVVGLVISTFADPLGKLQFVGIGVAILGFLVTLLNPRVRELVIEIIKTVGGDKGR
jgi:hypothetical protein